MGCQVCGTEKSGFAIFFRERFGFVKNVSTKVKKAMKNEERFLCGKGGGVKGMG